MRMCAVTISYSCITYYLLSCDVRPQVQHLNNINDCLQSKLDASIEEVRNCQIQKASIKKEDSIVTKLVRATIMHVITGDSTQGAIGYRE